MEESTKTMQESTREVVEEYISTLSDLVVNSKPHINLLTILAEESIKHAPEIVRAIESHLQKVRSDVKLPVLYVIDSIVKNVKKDYITLFTEHIVETFSDVFEKVDEETRANMYKLRQTWVNVFDDNTLFSIDLQIHQIDPAWPITATPSSIASGSIHLNPRFFNQQNKPAPEATKIAPEKINNNLMRDQLLQKQRKLLQLQKQKIELELQQTEATIEQQTKQLNTKAMLLKDDLYPTASATLFKSINTPSTGPRIAPASSAVVSAVAAAKQVSRDPRLKSTSVTETQETADETVSSVVPSTQLQLAKTVTSAVATLPTSSVSNNVIRNANSNNKMNINKDASLHRSSQKKDSRLSSNLSGSNSPKTAPQNQPKSPDVSISQKPSLPKQTSSCSPTFKAKTAEKRRSTKSSPQQKPQQCHEEVSKSCGQVVLDVDDEYDPAAPVVDPDSELSISSSSPPTPPPLTLPKNRRSKAKSSRKCPSPVPYRIPKRIDKSSVAGVTEEEQSGSLIVSPPHPPAFKDIRQNAKQRNYIRRNKDGSRSPDSGSTPSVSDAMLDAANKDEDLRANIVIPPITVEKKEDLDLRIIAPVGAQKRQSTDPIESVPVKKTKEEKFDELFGNEDVDLRTLTHPNAGRPPTPPPPVISGDDGKDSWAKLKPQVRNDRDKPSTSADEKRERDRNRDRLGRPRLYNKLPDDPKERRRTLQTNEDTEVKSCRRNWDNYDRNAEMNIESLEKIMKDAAEMLNQGDITKTQYNVLIQKVLHMSEDRKLRAAQRKEKEIWDKGYDKSHDRSHFGPNDSDKFRPRNPAGPRWQGHPWQQSHFPHADFSQSHFNPGYRQMGPHPWQNPPRHFNPMRPDFQFHPFNPPMAPNPRMPGMLGPMGHNGSMLGPNPMINPLHNIGPMMPNMANMNGPMGPTQIPKFGGAPLAPRNQVPATLPIVKCPPENIENNEVISNNVVKGDFLNLEVPPPDPQILEQAAMDPMKSITIDGTPREIRYYGSTGVVFWEWDDPREIGFQNGMRRALINDKDSLTLMFNGPYQEFMFEGQMHKIRLGTPTKELYIDDKFYECCFGGMPTIVDLNGKKVSIKLEGPPPRVRISDKKRTDLVLAKINLIINAGIRTPVYLDAKPQRIEIDGQTHTLEFIDALRTVLINGTPFQFEFGGLPKPVIIGGKKHYLRFSVLPQGCVAGKVKIAGMRGEPPSESPPTSPLSQKANTEAAPISHFNSPLDQDTSSQDAKITDTQLDMLSSALPSAMAPASGLAYEAENPPAPTVPSEQNLDIGVLFQKLMDNGVFALFANKNEPPPKEEKEPEKKEPEARPSFITPESVIKMKYPNLFKKFYEGVQCSSCGVRFLPDDMTTRYSQHLDWHFRQNRRKKDTARKAHSRSWYYDVSDWIQFEEIEDLEDRAQSWFETERQTAEDGASANRTTEDTRPSVPAGSEPESRCEMCHDAFDLFFNEEEEEWHVRPAVKFEDKNYHPLCLEDHKRALERSALFLDNLDDSLNKTNEDIETKEDTVEEITDCVNETEEIKEETSIEDKEDEEEVKEIKEQIDEKMEEDPDIIMEKIVDPSSKKIVQAEIILDDDDDEDENMENKEEEQKDQSEQVKQQPEVIDFTKIKIKQEPLDEIIAPDEKLIQEAAVVDTTQVVIRSTIDGNVEIDSIPAAMPTVPQRIKININSTLIRSTSPKDKNDSKEQEKAADKISKPEPEYEPLTVKPKLRNKKLTKRPPVLKGEEYSALCSIM